MSVSFRTISYSIFILLVNLIGINFWCIYKKNYILENTNYFHVRPSAKKQEGRNLQVYINI